MQCNIQQYGMSCDMCIVFYVVLHIGLAAISLVWLVCSCMIPQVLLFTNIVIMYFYILAWLPWGSCGWHDPTVLHTYHYIYILFYVVLHIGLTAMSLVWLMCWCTIQEGEVGGWGRDPFSRNFMKPTPRRKWYLTTGRRFH